MEICWLDIVILIPIIYGLGHGLLRGFVREFTSIFAILAGVLAGKFFAPKFAAYLLTVINMSERAALLLAYVLLFIGVALLFKLLAQAFTRFLRKVDLSWLNRLVGAAKQQSQLYEPTCRLASVAKGEAEKYLKMYTKEVEEEKAKEAKQIEKQEQ